jgi:hypothetical protein
MKYERLRRNEREKEKWFSHKEPEDFDTLMRTIEPKVIFPEEKVEKIWSELYAFPMPCKIWILGYENEDYFKLRKAGRKRDSLCERATIKEHGRLIDVEESSAFNFFVPKVNIHFIMYRLHSSKTLEEQIKHELQHVYNIHCLGKIE